MTESFECRGVMLLHSAMFSGDLLIYHGIMVGRWPAAVVTET